MPSRGEVANPDGSSAFDRSRGTPGTAMQCPWSALRRGEGRSIARSTCVFAAPVSLLRVLRRRGHALLGCLERLACRARSARCADAHCPESFDPDWPSHATPRGSRSAPHATLTRRWLSLEPFHATRLGPLVDPDSPIPVPSRPVQSIAFHRYARHHADAFRTRLDRRRPAGDGDRARHHRRRAGRQRCRPRHRAYGAVAAAHGRFAATSHALLDAIPNTIVVSRPTVTTTMAVPVTLEVYRPASTLYVTARPTLVATAVASPPSSSLVPVTSPVVAEHARARSEVPAWTMWSVARLVLFNLAAHLLVFRQKVRPDLSLDSADSSSSSRVSLELRSRPPVATSTGSPASRAAAFVRSSTPATCTASSRRLMCVWLTIASTDQRRRHCSCRPRVRAA